MTTQQPEALQCAADIEAQLEAIGAGGVSGPLIGQPQAMPDLSQLTERGAKAWAGVDAQGLREGFTAADMATVSAQGFRDGVASVSAQAADSVLEDAARWNEVLMHVGAAYHLGGQHFTLNTLRILDQMYLLRGSVAQHFTACIDDSRAARKQEVRDGLAAILPELFREALAWGMTYGPEIPAHQWDQMRESMVNQYVSRAARAPAESVPAVSDLPPLPDPDLRDVGTKPQEIKEFLKGYATEYARTAIAARAPADSMQEDAALWHWLAEYLVGTRTDLDDEIVASETVNDLRKLVKAAITQGATQ